MSFLLDKVREEETALYEAYRGWIDTLANRKWIKTID